MKLRHHVSLKLVFKISKWLTYREVINILEWDRLVAKRNLQRYFSYTANRCAGGLRKKLDLRPGSQRHRHFIGIFNVPAQAPTGGQPFYGYSEKPPDFNRLLRRALGIRRSFFASVDHRPSIDRQSDDSRATSWESGNLWPMIGRLVGDRNTYTFTCAFHNFVGILYTF